MAANEKPIVNDKKNTNPPPAKKELKPAMSQAEANEKKAPTQEINIAETIASFDETLNSLFGNELFNTELGVDINDPDFEKNAKKKTASNVKPVENIKPAGIEKQAAPAQAKATAQPASKAPEKAASEPKVEIKNNPEHISMLKQNAKEIKDLTDLNNNLNNNLKQYKSDNQQLINENKHQAETIEKAKSYIERIKQEYLKVANINQEFAAKFEQLKKDIQDKAKDAIIESKKTYEEKLKELDEKNKEERQKQQILFQESSKMMKQEYDKLADQFRLSQAKLKETSDLYNDTVADSHSFKERIDKEKKEALKYANVKLVDELLLPLEQLESTCNIVYDNPEINNFILGFKLINRQLFQILEAYGLKEIEIPENTVFDPNFHEAHETVNIPDKDDDVIVEVIKKGYLFKDRLLRAALVVVNKK